MTERENLLHVLKRTGEAKWAPIMADCMLGIVPTPIKDRPTPNGVDGYDWFGCHWTFDHDIQGYAQTPGHPLPLTDLSKWREQIKFPDLDAIDWEAGAKKDLENFDRENKALHIFTDSGAYERFFQLYGMAETFVALIEEPELCLEIMDALADFRIKFYEKIATHYKPDTVFVMDDLGSSNGPLISMEMYREFIKPFDKKIIKSIHDNDIYVMYHSCGCMEDFIEDLIEIGADIIQPFQGGINNQEKAQEAFGDRVIFCRGLNNLVHLSSATEEALRKEMRRVLDLFWPKKNLIVQTLSYYPDNIPILLDEAHKYNAELLSR
ncbi:MAG: hypothetical protein FWC66_03935 [Oscillospiraceae bacterium]|nr:hypothetical protein [Oscillospiraceae bacterium]